MPGAGAGAAGGKDKEAADVTGLDGDPALQFCATVFSVSNYCGAGNKAAVLHLTCDTPDAKGTLSLSPSLCLPSD